MNEAESGGHNGGKKGPRLVALLGAQRFEPSLRMVVDAQGVSGRTALITAGWQEREPEDEELSAHLGGNTVNLRLHLRADHVFAKDREFLQAHRERQRLLRHLQEVYRIRLEHAFEAERDVHAYDAPEAIREEVWEASLEAIRTLDTWHLDHCRSVRREFEERMKPAERDGVVRHRGELARLLEDCTSVAIAGGHVAVLLNRLDLFGLAELIGERPVFAWSAGAMAVTDRIVLFHDDPPEGRVARQVLDEGLGFVPNTVVFPNPERRLALDEQERVSLARRRFAPAACIAFPSRSWLVWQEGRVRSSDGVIEMRSDGTHGVLGAHGSPGASPEGAGSPPTVTA